MGTSLDLCPVVYVDESMNSGQNLLDPAQPVFTVAGVHLPDELAASLVEGVRVQLPPNLKEAKYRSVVGSSRGQKALMRVFEQLPAGSIRSYLVYKPLMVADKMVDLLIEEWAYAAGFVLYQNDLHKTLGELLHVCGPVFGDAERYEQLLQAFVAWARERVTTDDLFAAVAAYKESVHHAPWGEFVDLLEGCRGVADEIAADIAAGRLPEPLDPAVPALYALSTSFGASLGEFRLVHDTSKVIASNVAVLRTVHLFEDPSRRGQFMKRLPVSRIEFADSKDHPQLQLADWAAGAVRQWATSLTSSGDSRGNRFLRELDGMVRPWVVGQIWPG